MAAKRKKKRSPLKRFLFLILTPLVVWFLAFVVWLYWSPITRLWSQGGDQGKTPPKADWSRDKSERSNLAGEKRGHEHITDDERKKLDDILRRQGEHNY